MSSQQTSKIAILILAAGSSSRMKRPKQLLPWNHSTMIANAIEQALGVTGNEAVYLVLGAYFDAIFEEVNQYPITILKNEDWHSGMGSSISNGVKAIYEYDSGYEGVLIMLADQPLIRTDDLNDLIKKSENYPTNIIVSDFGDVIGVPAIFPNQYFNDLFKLKEDYGARYLIRNHKDQVKTVKLLNKGQDVDTIEEYQALLKKR
ncbi:nucleotidyltransferase family protein [Aquimarina sp. 2201CG5-10]|uniref:nucleotidyltransferase family protein n=1 Tax=Aquimarina callyspongiae TaxID=3098150 RepID=UPI002AB4F870|nr:nucleotidyltransferase family protein [Aquimarina sp. 2201CG5-10]MDY8136356.1 nucleotidyltransferase family protein [Aquimarina sp. 2201CG5-10]